MTCFTSPNPAALEVLLLIAAIPWWVEAIMLVFACWMITSGIAGLINDRVEKAVKAIDGETT